MLAQCGRWCRWLHRWRLTAVDHWLAAHLHSAAIGRCHWSQQPAFVYPGVLEEAKHVEHWTIGHVVSVQPCGPVLVRLRGKERRQLCHQCAPMSLSLAQVGITRVLGQVGPPDRGAEPQPEALIKGSDGDMTVLSLEGTHGHHRGVHRTGGLRWLPGRLG